MSNPNGGVSKPASIINIPKIAKASSLMPNKLAIGANIGTVSKMIDVESINIPNNNQITKISDSNIAGFSLIENIVSWITPIAPPMAKKREYIDAVIRRIIIGAVVLPAM